MSLYYAGGDPLDRGLGNNWGSWSSSDDLITLASTLTVTSTQLAQAVLEWDHAACALAVSFAADAKQRLNDLLDSMLDQIIGALGSGGASMGLIGDYKACAQAMQGGDNYQACQGAGEKTVKVVNSLIDESGGFDYVGALETFVTWATGVVISKLFDVVKDAILKNIDKIFNKVLGLLGCSAGGAGPVIDEQPGGTLPAGGSGANAAVSASEPVVATGGPQSGTGVPDAVVQRPPPPPPPLYMGKKGIDWMTYLLWGGMGLGVALAASKTLTGAWVPPQVARRAAPVTTKVKAKVKQLRR